MKAKFSHKTVYDAGKTVSKTPKPKDWAFRTPSEGRPKSVISKRCKPIKMSHEIHDCHMIRNFLVLAKAGKTGSQLQITCENPARKLTAQDVLDVMYSEQKQFEVKFNREKAILIFVDLTETITGGHEENDDEVLTELRAKYLKEKYGQ